MHVKVFVVLVAVILLSDAYSKTKKLSRLRTDPLAKTRCDLVCYDVNKESKAQCRSQCRSHQQKPGACPEADSPQWAAACVEACTLDAQCDDTQRCCRHGCSASCAEPIDLLTLPGLPALPVMEEAKEKRKSVIVRWSDGVGDAARAVPGRILYLLEEQHHLGPKYEEARLGEWNLLLRTNKTRVSLRNLLKPGRWYRFRVAAVSASGTRGFSVPSAPFTPRRGPRAPPAPKKLKVRALRTDNGTVTVRLEWREPRSDLPVMRYKVYWSRRVRGLGGELDSVLVNHQTVSKDQNHVDIKGLQPNSMYFLQVQTISQFGLGKLRSEKAAIFYNTTTNGHPPETLQRRDRKVKNLRLNKVIWFNNKLKARISWEPNSRPDEQAARRYFIHWKAVKCGNPQSQNKELSATTEQTNFEIYELDYHCSYKVNVNKSPRSKTMESELLVQIPGCEYFQRRVNTTINC